MTAKDWPELSDDPETYNLLDAPGHLMRRMQQRALEIFTEEMGPDGPTPRQFAVLLTAFRNPGLNQTELVHATRIDRSTVGELVARLVKRGWIERRRTRADGRSNTLHVTPAGADMLRRAIPAVNRAQVRIMAPLAEEERAAFLHQAAQLSDLPDSREDGANDNPAPYEAED